MERLIVNPKYIWDGTSSEVSADKAVLIEGGIARAFGKADSLKASYPDAKLISNDDWLMVPAFTDAHDHGRGVSPVAFGAFDQALETWLLELNRLVALPHYEACYFDGIRLVSSGVGTVLHSHNPNSFSNMEEELVNSARGYIKAGVRSILSPLYIDQNKRIYYDRDRFIDNYMPADMRDTYRGSIRDQIMTMDEYLGLIEAVRKDLEKEIEEGWVEIQLHPNGGQWVSDEGLLAMKDYAISHNMSVNLHLLETQYQKECAYRAWGKNYISHYNDIGFLGPWVSFAHSVWLDEEEYDLVAKSGAKLVTNPSSNLRLRSGIFNMAAARKAGVTCGIGLDGCAIDDDQDYLREMRVAWLNNRTNGVNAKVDCLDILKMGTSEGATVAHNQLSSGVLCEGRNADFVCISLDKLNYPYADEDLSPLALLIQRGKREFVEFTYVNGRQVWGTDSIWAEKEKDAASLVNSTIKELRKGYQGRNNEAQVERVRRFYTENGLGSGVYGN